MQVTVDLKEILILVLLAALIVMVIYATIMIANLIKSLKKVNLVLDDSKQVTAVVAKKSEQIDGLIDEASDVALEVVGIVKGNMSTIEKVKGFSQGVASVKGIVDKFRNDDDEEVYVKRTKKSRK